MPRGSKICDKCGEGNGPRAKVCKKCENAFVFKVKSKEERTTKKVEVNWRELQKGDKIRSSGGPYFEKHGEFTPMGYRGKFVVDSVDPQGIRAFGLDKYSGFCYIYMGRDRLDRETNIWKVRHKVQKIVSKKNV